MAKQEEPSSGPTKTVEPWIKITACRRIRAVTTSIIQSRIRIPSRIRVPFFFQFHFPFSAERQRQLLEPLRVGVWRGKKTRAVECSREDGTAARCTTGTRGFIVDGKTFQSSNHPAPPPTTTTTTTTTTDLFGTTGHRVGNFVLLLFFLLIFFC